MEPFGETVFSKYTLDVIYVTCVDGSWFQYPDVYDAAAAVKRAASDYDEVLNYGTSMGGYGALAFSEYIGSTVVIACSPQYSIDIAKVPFENRYLNDLPRVADHGGFIRDNLNENLSKKARVILLFDPFDDIDKKHAALVEGHRPCERLVVPFSGHKSLISLREMGLASEVVRSAAGGQLDVKRLRRAIRVKRVRSQTYLRFLARALNRRKWAGVMTLVEMAAAIGDAENWDGLRTDIRLAIEHQSYDLAIQQTKKLLKIEPYFKRYMVVKDYSRWAPVLVAAGYGVGLKDALSHASKDTPEGADHFHLLGALISASNKDAAGVKACLSRVENVYHNAQYSEEIAEILLVQGNAAELIDFLQEAVRTQPGNLRFINLLSDHLFRLGRRVEALDVLNRARHVVKLPMHPLRFRLAKLLELDGQVEKALREADALLEVNPSDWLAHRLQGACLATLGRHIEACQAFEQAIDIPNHAAHASYGLALSQLALGNRAGALSTVRHGLRAEPTSKALEMMLERLQRLDGSPTNDAN